MRTFSRAAAILVLTELSVRARLLHKVLGALMTMRPAQGDRGAVQ